MLLWLPLAHGQDLHFEHLDERNGLPQLGISAFFQGPRGFLWVGTQNGVFRFDGQTFESFSEANGKSEINLPVIDIHGKYGTIAILTPNHIVLIGNLEQKVTKLSLPPGKLVKPKYILILTDEILIGSENGLWKVDIESGVVHETDIKEPVTGLEILGPGRILISTSDGFQVYYPFIKKHFRVNYHPDSYIRILCPETDGKISWLEGDSYFHRGKIENGMLKEEISVHLSQSSGSTCLTHYQGWYYLGLNHGILAFNTKGEERLIRRNEEDLFSLSQNQVTCMLRDRHNNLWVGTALGGINLHHPERFMFQCISPQFSLRYSKCKEVLSFTEGPGGLVLLQNTLGGLGIFDPVAKSFLKWVATGINGNCILPLPEEPDRFLIGSPEGLFEYRLMQDKIEQVTLSGSKETYNHDIKSILQESGNLYWMGGSEGLKLFDLAQRKVLKGYDIGNSRLGSDNIRSLTRLDATHLLISTGAGLYRFYIPGETFDLIPFDDNPKQPFVSSVKIDAAGNWWVGTSGQGLFQMRNNKVINHWTETNGLPNNQIYAIVTEPGKQVCWLSTNGGIARVDGQHKVIDRFGLHEGLQGIEFTESSSLFTKDGYLYFGGINGFNFFHPDKIVKDTLDVPVRIKGVSLFNKKEDYTDYYRIPSEKNFVTIEFAALDYCLKKKQVYYYRLEGLQPEWTEIGDRRFASFGQLKPGDYVFHVRAQNDAGAMGRSEGRVYFSIIPPFYQTWWFRFGIILILASVLAYFIYYRTRTAIAFEQEKGRQSKMIAELELKALRAQMDPHFIFNSLNSIQDFVLNNQGDQAARYLSKFARLIRMILDISEQTFISIQLEADFLKLYIELEALRLGHDFTYAIHLDPNLDFSCQIPALLIQPHVENAIWHGLQHKSTDRKLSITFHQVSEDMMEVTVEDNGVGRKAAQEMKNQRSEHYRSRASKNAEERVHALTTLFGSKPKIQVVDLFTQNRLACGTKVTIQIPVLHG